MSSWMKTGHWPRSWTGCGPTGSARLPAMTGIATAKPGPPVLYDHVHAYERTRNQMAAIYDSLRLKLPFEGVLLIGYQEAASLGRSEQLGDQAGCYALRMAEQEALKYLEEHIEEQIRGFESSKNYYRRGSYIQTILAATLGATTTFLIGLNQIYHFNWLAALSLASAALTTIVAAWGAWFGFRRLWVTYQGTLNELYELRSNIRYTREATSNSFSQTMVDDYCAQYQRILKKANVKWEEARSSQE